MTPEQFLSLVLPRKGLKFTKILQPSYCKAVNDRGRPPHDRWHQDVAEMAAYQLDVNRNPSCEVYFALAGFEKDTARDANNAAFFRCFWVDVDLWEDSERGRDHKYHNVSEACEAVYDFCEKIGLPYPLVVTSGRGIHAYWPLDDDIDKATWKQHAIGLKSLLAAEGVDADPSVTADAARILRCPGTRNKKPGRGAVKIIQDAEDPGMDAGFPLERFAPLSNVAGHIGGRGIAERARAGRRSLGDEDALPDFEPWTDDTELHLRQCLEKINPHDRETWVEVMLALSYWGTAVNPAIEPLLWTIFDEWSRRTPGSYELEENQRQWADGVRRAKGRDGQPKLTYRSIIHMAGGLASVPKPEDTRTEKSVVERFNANHFCIMKGSDFVYGYEDETGNIRFMKKDSFRNMYEADRVLIGDKRKKELKPAADFWLKNPARRQYNGCDMFELGREPVGWLNQFKGFAITEKQGEWPRLRRHIKNILADGDLEAEEYILKFCAWMFQHPLDRCEVAMVFQGVKGSGKSTFADEVIRPIFGRHGKTAAQSNLLVGTHNEILDGCLFLHAEEAFFAADPRNTSVLNSLITMKEININPKHISTYAVKNRLKIIMSTNADWSVPVEMNERRYAVFQTSAEYGEGFTEKRRIKEYFTELHKELNNGGLAAFLYDMRHMALDGWHPRDSIPQNAALHAQKEHSLKPLEQWMKEILETGVLPAPPSDKGCGIGVAALWEHFKNCCEGDRRGTGGVNQIGFGIMLTKWGWGRVTNHGKSYRTPPSLLEGRAIWRKVHPNWPFDLKTEWEK